MEYYRVRAGTGIGHVPLKVADIDRALGWHAEVPGFDEIMRVGDQAAFISAGGIELTRDRPESEWPRDADGNIAGAMADPHDLEPLLREASA